MRPVERWLRQHAEKDNPQLYERVHLLHGQLGEQFVSAAYSIFFDLTLADAVIAPQTPSYYIARGDLSARVVQTTIEQLIEHGSIMVSEARKGVHRRLYPTPWTEKVIGDVLVCEEKTQAPHAFYNGVLAQNHTNPQVRAQLQQTEKFLKDYQHFMSAHPLSYAGDSPFTLLYGLSYSDRLRNPWTQAGLVSPRAVLSRKFTSKGDGRLYQTGNSYQQLPKRVRQHLTVGGTRLVELDYTASHLSVLCGLAGEQQPFDDPYKEITRQAGISIRQRDDVKRLTIIALNTPDVKSFERGTWRHRDIRQRMSDAGVPISRVRDAVIETFPFVQRFFGEPTLPNRIMFEESEIVCDVLQRARAQGIPLFPIHDCVLAPTTEQHTVYELLLDAFHTRFPTTRARVHPVLPMPTRPIEEKAKRSNKRTVSPDQHNLAL